MNWEVESGEWGSLAGKLNAGTAQKQTLLKIQICCPAIGAAALKGLSP